MGGEEGGDSADRTRTGRRNDRPNRADAHQFEERARKSICLHVHWPGCGQSPH